MQGVAAPILDEAVVHLEAPGIQHGAGWIAMHKRHWQLSTLNACPS